MRGLATSLAGAAAGYFMARLLDHLLGLDELAEQIAGWLRSTLGLVDPTAGRRV